MAEISIANRYRTENGCEVVILKTGLAGEYSVLGLMLHEGSHWSCSWTKEGKAKTPEGKTTVPEWNLVEVTCPEVKLHFKYKTLDGSRVTLVSDKGTKPDCILGIVHRDTWDFPWRWDKYGKSSWADYNLEELSDDEDRAKRFG